VGEVDVGEHLVDAAAGSADHVGEVLQVAPDGEVGVHRRALRDVADARRLSASPAGRPSTESVPRTPAWTPTTERSSVDLPQPLGPSSPVIRPAGTVNVSPCSTSFPRRLTCRSWASIADVVMC
jgi:hypothetical protein